MTPFLLWPLGATILLFVLRLILIPKPLPGIPYSRRAYLLPWGDLVSLGNSFMARGEVFAWFSARSHYHRSPIYQAFIPSLSISHPVVVVTDPVEVREIVTRRLSSIDRSRLLDQWFGLLAPGASIGMSSGAEFRALKWAWNSMLSPAFLGSVAGPRARDAALGLVELWSLKGGTEPVSPFEACADLKLATLEAMVASLLGKELGMLGVESADLENVEDRKRPWPWERSKREVQPRRFYRDFSLCLVCLIRITQGFSPTFYSWVFRHLFWPFQKARNHVETCLQRVIDDARQQSAVREKAAYHPHSALELVLDRAASRPEAQDAMSDAALRSELIELLITGHETTASSLGWAVKYLADDQGVQDSLHEELTRLLPDSGTAPTSEQIMATRLPYLDAFIAESLRYSCTGPISFREAVQDCNILGYRIPSGTPIVLMTQDVTHQQATYRSQELKPAPRSPAGPSGPDGQVTPEPPLDEFHPGRWLSSVGDFNPNAAASMPFSAGSRGCSGQKIAMLELRVFLVILLWNFRFARLDAGLSRYGSLDGLTRKPSCCFVKPVPRRGRAAGRGRPRLPPLCED